jgi:hypothetical protein
MDIEMVSFTKVAGNDAHPLEIRSHSQSQKDLEIGLKYRLDQD